MNETDVLVLNGSPGAGKTTLADAIARELLNSNVRHAVIDLDELARIYPENVDVLNLLKWKNLAAIWPNFAAFGDIKVIIPVLIDTQEDFTALQKATPSKRFTVCFLTAPKEILKQRVTDREPNEYWKNRLSGLVDRYHERGDDRHFGDFEIDTTESSVENTARQIAQKLEWLQ